MIMKHELLEDHTHSFIVKVWLERTPAENNSQAIWRGHITHVPSGERRYLKDLDVIPAFIASYLEDLGVQLSTRRRITSYFERLRKYLCNPSRSQQTKESGESPR
jgi:hypothetical protein